MDDRIRFNCVSCGIELEAPKEILGVHVRCDQCDTKQAVLDKNSQSLNKDQATFLSQKKTKKSSFKISKTSSKRKRKNKQKNNVVIISILLTLILAATSILLILRLKTPLERKPLEVSFSGKTVFDEEQVVKAEVDIQLKPSRIKEIDLISSSESSRIKEIDLISSSEPSRIEEIDLISSSEPSRIEEIDLISSSEVSSIQVKDQSTIKLSSSIKHFIKKRCQDCHGEIKQKGDQRFDKLPDVLNKAHSIQLLQDILDTVNLSEMPPEDEPDIPHEELTNFIDELTQTISKAKDYTQNRGLNPPIRFLNKRELKLTYRDLLGVNTSLGSIPDAPEISRFDTIAQDQLFSEVHWQASFNVAKAHLEKALLSETNSKVIKIKYESETNKIKDFQKKINQWPGLIIKNTKKLETETVTQRRGNLNNLIKSLGNELEFAKKNINNPLFKTGAIYSKSTPIMTLLGKNIYNFDKMKEGRYRLKIRCGTIHTKPDQQSFISTASHKQLINPEFQPYENYYQEVTGTVKNPEVLFFNWNFGGQSSGRELRIDSDAEIWIDWIELEGPLKSQYLAQAEIELLSQYSEWDIAKAVKIVKDFAFKAYRGRNISFAQLEQIKDHLLSQSKLEADPQDALVDVLAVILSSPEFIYIVPELNKSNKNLTALSFVNKLSYFLLSSQPDLQLQKMVAANKSLSKRAVFKECDRILDSEKILPFIDSFVFQWLELSRFIALKPTIHAQRTNLIKWPRKKFSMLRESTEAMRFIIKNNRPITDLLNPDYYYINNTLAKYYGLPISNKKGFSARPLVKSNPRGGISSHASFLMMTSRGNRTSPVERGVYIMRNLLFNPPAPAPPNVPDLTASIKKTIEERFTLKKLNLSKSRELMFFHTKQAQCNSCHRSFDPLGFVLEGFDHYGSWQGEEINVKSKLPSGLELDGVKDLKKYLVAREEQFVKGFIKALMSYAIHRPISIVDQAEIDAIYNANKYSNFKIRNIIKSIVASKTFRGS